MPKKMDVVEPLENMQSYKIPTPGRHKHNKTYKTNEQLN